MDSPTTLKSTSPAENFFNPSSGNPKFEFPSCISPTENDEYVSSVSQEQNHESNLNQVKHINEKKEEKKISDNQNRVSSKRKKRNDRKSISLDTPIKLLSSEEKSTQNRKYKEVFQDSIIENKIGSLQNRKYSVLTMDGSIKNFVSENSEEFKKTNEIVNKENVTKKKSGTRRSSECPQRHRRVSIIQGESLRHFIFEEPDTSRMKSSKHRKVSMAAEDTTRKILLEDIQSRKSSMIPHEGSRNLLGEDSPRKSSMVPDDKPRKFSINTLGKENVLFAFLSFAQIVS